MPRAENLWIVVLAAGEGRRLQALTANSAGIPVPKQYCSFGRDRSMLQWALDRARCIVPRDRVVTVVAREHRQWWERELASTPRSNIVVQPRNRGTAAGILLPILEILRTDPGATIAILPSDHFIEDEDAFAFSTERAIEIADRGDRAVLLGITPDAAETGYGWIVPGRLNGGARSVARFVEKPPADEALELLARGAVWNSFVLAARGRLLLELYAEAVPDLCEAFLNALVLDPRPGGLDELYEALPVRDFSRDVLEKTAERLAVVVAPRCGWTDLGTPVRLTRFLAASDAVTLSAS